jgi:voltage-gated potassium channel
MDAQSIVDAVALGSLYALVAVGVALVFGVLRIVNFAHGELITAGAYALVLTDEYGSVTAIAVCFAVVVVLAAGTLGFALIFNVGVLQALFDTVTVVSTLGYRQVPDTTGEEVFIIVLILLGVSTVLYAFSVVLEAIIEGQLGDVFGRRRMERKIGAMKGHVIVCGWGRVGRAIVGQLAPDVDVVVIDNDATRIAEIPHPNVQGDATDDAVLQKAGIERCRALVAAVTSDADNLYQIALRELEIPLFLEVLEHCDGNQSRAATMLGIHRATLRKKLREYGIA